MDGSEMYLQECIYEIQSELCEAKERILDLDKIVEDRDQTIRDLNIKIEAMTLDMHYLTW